MLGRREFLAAAAGAALAGGCKRAAGANVLVLMVDEHNPRVASIYGHPSVQTPNLERLAGMGTVFENAYCPSPLCMPSRSAFMAGRPVHALQTYSNCNALTYDYAGYGQALSSQGVHTAYIGKTDVYRPGAALGFDEMLRAGDRTPPGDMCIRRKPLHVREDGAARASGYGPHPAPFGGDDAVMETALEWLQSRPGTLATPWTLTVNLGKPHFPHHVTQELWDLYPDGGDLPGYGVEQASAGHPYAQDLRRHFQTEAFTEEQVRGLRRGYLGCVTYVDRQLGRLLDMLEAEGLLDNTVVVYTADHGDMLGKFGMWWKCSLYEDSVRVPLVAAGPGFGRGARVRTPVELHDAQASMFAACGVRRPPEWRGTALQDIVAADGTRPVFSEYHGHGVRAGAYMLRMGDWKLIYCVEAPHLLFNLGEDPEELTNLAEAQPGMLGKLEAALREICDPEAENQRAEAVIARQLGMIVER